MHIFCIHLYPYPEKTNREIYKPNKIIGALGKYNIIYRDYLEKNPADLIVFLFNIYHNELNSKKDNKTTSKINTKNYQNDKKKVIHFGIIDFVNNNNSIISNYFIWFNIKKIICNKCLNEIYFFQNFPIFD